MFKKLMGEILKLIQSLKNSSKRFPETLLVAIGIVTLGIILNHTNYNDTQVIENLRKILMTLILGLPLFSAVKLLIERFKLKLSFRLGIDLISALFLAVFDYFIPETYYSDFIVKYVLLNISFYLIFSLVPYFLSRVNYSRYVLKLVTNFFITILFSMVIYGGISAIIFTVEKLFELNFNSDIYLDIYITVAGLFAITHFLGNLPQIEQDIEDDYFPPVWRILFIYIVLPLLSMYTVILYAYFIRLLILREFPINILGHLVVWYGLISVFILFFINRIKSSNLYAEKFYRFFPIVIMLPLAMLFMAIGSRIIDFGITPPRYFVVISGLWILGNMLYIFFSKSFKSSVLVITAVIVLLASAYGPQSAFNLSLSNQNNRFETLLNDYKMLENHKIIPNKNLTSEEQLKINEFVQYFERNHNFESVRVLPEDFTYDQMKEVFGFDYFYYYYHEDKNDVNYYLNKDMMILNVSGYDYLADVFIDINMDSRVEDDHLKAIYQFNDKKMSISIEGEKLAEIDMKQFFKDFDERRGGIQPRTIEEMTNTFEFDKATIKFITMNLSYSISASGDTFEYGSTYFKMLVKVK
ncbi:MAG: DUF4153 domain-containing protein [Clostridiales bacterium]|nr:DUF4153 domain-containing protein [Clostridiales bacterium]